MTTRAAWRGAVAAALAAVALEALLMTDELRGPMTGIVVVAFVLSVVAVGYLRGRWTAIPLTVVCLFVPVVVWAAIEDGTEGWADGVFGDQGDLEGLDYLDGGGLLSDVIFVMQAMLPISIVLPAVGLLLRAVVRRIGRRSRQA